MNLLQRETPASTVGTPVMRNGLRVVDQTHSQTLARVLIRETQGLASMEEMWLMVEDRRGTVRVGGLTLIIRMIAASMVTTARGPGVAGNPLR